MFAVFLIEPLIFTVAAFNCLRALRSFCTGLGAGSCGSRAETFSWELKVPSPFPRNGQVFRRGSCDGVKTAHGLVWFGAFGPPELCRDLQAVEEWGGTNRISCGCRARGDLTERGKGVFEIKGSKTF